MPKYRVTKSFAHANPVGSYVYSDDLHPFLHQHVTMIDERPVAEIYANEESGIATDEPEKKPVVKRPARQPVSTEKEKPLTAEQIEAMHAEAIDIDKVLYPVD